MYAYTYVWSHVYGKSMDHPGKVANPARGQLNRENKYFPVRQSRPASASSSP